MKNIQVPDEEINEMIEYFEKKRDRLSRELQIVSATLINLTGTNGSSSISNVANGSSIAWKYKIDEVLKQTDIPLPASKILSLLIEIEPELVNRTEAVRKSVASALSTNSKDDKSRYIKTVDKGLTYYELNPNFRE